MFSTYSIKQTQRGWPHGDQRKTARNITNLYSTVTERYFECIRQCGNDFNYEENNTESDWALKTRFLKTRHRTAT